MRKSKLSTKIEERIAILQKEMHDYAQTVAESQVELQIRESKLALLTELIEEDNTNGE